MQSALALTYRKMKEADLDRILQIENSAYPLPWSEGIFRDCLRAGYTCTLCELDGELVGYSILSVAADEGHLLNLCLYPDYQGKGLGRQMLRHTISLAEKKGAKTLFLEVRVSNSAANQLYLSEGFNEIAQRLNYYPASNGREDALVFAKSLM